MPFRRTGLDYLMTTILLIAFLVAFFVFSAWGDLHGQTNPDKASASRINDFVVIGPLILIYEMFQLVVLPGKRRGRELPWRLYGILFTDTIRQKFISGLHEYRSWRKRKN